MYKVAFTQLGVETTGKKMGTERPNAHKKKLQKYQWDIR